MKIEDEFSKVKGISRQRRYQLRKVREGKCMICAEPSVIKGYCEHHRWYVNRKAIGRE